MKVLVTGANGFIGRNLCVALAERGCFDVLTVTRSTTDAEIERLASKADAVVHLAGVNRPRDPIEFEANNADFTASLCQRLLTVGRPIPVAFASSIQVEREGPYGASKLQAEAHLAAYGQMSGAPVGIFRLVNVFGKWSQPNYNSVVATFCNNIARGLPIRIDDPSAAVQLAYIDDVVSAMIDFILGSPPGVNQLDVEPVYVTTVGEVAKQIEAFATMRTTLVAERVGSGLTRALYATYVSFLPTKAFSYPLPSHSDARGVFVEMLKTPDCGQFSFFTAHPGVTRGGHYHHTKTEKFLVIKGTARYRFRNLITDEIYELGSSGDEPLIVDSIPGWAHDITNVGEDELVVMLWANEIFDRQRPDTVPCKL